MMKLRFLFSLLTTCFTLQMNAQNSTDYYYEIPDYPPKYTAGAVAGRVADGLGFRYYHATAGLTAENMSFKSNEDGRTIEQTMDHIWSLCRIVMNATNEEPTDFTAPNPLADMTFEEKRTQTLKFIKVASDNLKKSSAKDFKKYQMIFLQAGGNKAEYPFWNELNGPLSDALWHTGQVVLMRRGAGNPFNSNASVLSGKVKN